MNKEQFLRYFKKKENASENNENITITNVVNSATKETINAELRFTADKIKKSNSPPKTYQKQFSENMKREVGKY